jgi:hypothetical protein
VQIGSFRFAVSLECAEVGSTRRHVILCRRPPLRNKDNSAQTKDKSTVRSPLVASIACEPSLTVLSLTFCELQLCVTTKINGPGLHGRLGGDPDDRFPGTPPCPNSSRRRRSSCRAERLWVLPCWRCSPTNRRHPRPPRFVFPTRLARRATGRFGRTLSATPGFCRTTMQKDFSHQSRRGPRLLTHRHRRPEMRGVARHARKRRKTLRAERCGRTARRAAIPRHLAAPPSLTGGAWIRGARMRSVRHTLSARTRTKIGTRAGTRAGTRTGAKIGTRIKTKIRIGIGIRPDRLRFSPVRHDSTSQSATPCLLISRWHGLTIPCRYPGSGAALPPGHIATKPRSCLG